MRVLFLTGSGLSADSGLPTFRGLDGLYSQLSAEEFLSARQYAQSPDLVEHWIQELRDAAARVSPNAAHKALASYQSRYPDTVLFTQNVDMLLERAGARKVIHLHGRLDRLRCVGHGHITMIGAAAPQMALAPCSRCRSALRSDVVLFGERAPFYSTLWRELEKSGHSDVLVVIGTQGIVMPINEITRTFRGRTILNNLHPGDTVDSALFDVVIEEPAADAAARLVDQLEQWRAPGN
jgi:NAD-dependent deacetylase